MRRAAIAAVVFLGILEFLLLTGSGERRGSTAFPVPSGRFQKGIVFGLFARDEPGYSERNLGEIRALGADAVSIVLPWVTPDVQATVIAPRGDMTPSDASLRHAIREAHGRGLRVLLLPLIYVDRMAEGEWRGTLSPPDWDAWFRSYGRMVDHYAGIAESERVEYLSVGSELCSTEERRDDWLRIIGGVRRAYGGLLTYSMNWDHRDRISFADALDALGMNAYFELSDDPEAGVEELRRAWSSIRSEVETWRSRLGKPLILTEVGYPSRRGAASNPWAYDAPGEADPAAQERCYRAFVGAWTGYPPLVGVYFYLWWGEGGPADTGYTPRGKPAEKVIADWYGPDRTGGAR